MPIRTALSLSPAAPAPAKATLRGGIAVVEKAMAIVNRVAAATHPLTFTDLLRQTGLPKATLHRILSTLLAEGLLRLEPRDRSYRLGLHVLELAHRVWADFDLRVAAEDELARLAEATGETIRLGVLDAAAVTVVSSNAPRQGTQFASEVGERQPFHATAMGKIIAAYIDSAGQRRLLESSSLYACTPATLTTVTALRADLDLARARGYAIESGEHTEGTSSVAVPILDHSGRAIAAIGLSGPSTRLDPARLHELASRLIGAARRISHSASGTSMSIVPAPRPVAESAPPVSCVLPTRSLLGEGPCWDAREQVLYWVDILKPALHRFDPATGLDEARPMDSMVSLAWPRARGGLLIAAQNGIVQFDFESGRRTPYAHPEEAHPANRYNDGKCDRRGRLWLGSLDMGTAPNRGSLFRIDPDGNWQQMDSGFTVSNGIGFSPDDKRMYFADSGRRTVYVYDFDLERGEIAHRRPFVQLLEKEGVPDGLTVDAEGFVWVAAWDGWTLIRYDPEGRVALRLPLPVPRPTSCCFGGRDLRTLYITTASVRLPEQALAEAPQSGALFACTPGVAGLPETAFGG